MSTECFSLDQLMELAGLSVAQAVYQTHPVSQGRNVLILAGPGNNGGDGLVAARHLHLWGYKPILYYPVQSGSASSHLKQLHSQLQRLGVPEITDFEKDGIKDMILQKKGIDHIIDGIFGFSFRGNVRAPFDSVISVLAQNSEKAKDKRVSVTSIDIPSSWDVNEGPVSTSSLFLPDYLVSLTAPKPASVHFCKLGLQRMGQDKSNIYKHFIGGRFISKEFAEKWGFDVPEYKDTDQVVETSLESGVAMSPQVETEKVKSV